MSRMRGGEGGLNGSLIWNLNFKILDGGSAGVEVFLVSGEG